MVGPKAGVLLCPCCDAHCVGLLSLSLSNTAWGQGGDVVWTACKDKGDSVRAPFRGCDGFALSCRTPALYHAPGSQTLPQQPHDNREVSLSLSNTASVATRARALLARWRAHASSVSRAWLPGPGPREGAAELPSPSPTAARGAAGVTPSMSQPTSPPRARPWPAATAVADPPACPDADAAGPAPTSAATHRASSPACHGAAAPPPLAGSSPSSPARSSTSWPSSSQRRRKVSSGLPTPCTTKPAARAGVGGPRRGHPFCPISSMSPGPMHPATRAPGLPALGDRTSLTAPLCVAPHSAPRALSAVWSSALRPSNTKAGRTMES